MPPKLKAKRFLELNTRDLDRYGAGKIISSARYVKSSLDAGSLVPTPEARVEKDDNWNERPQRGRSTVVMTGGFVTSERSSSSPFRRQKALVLTAPAVLQNIVFNLPRTAAEPREKSTVGGTARRHFAHEPRGASDELRGRRSRSDSPAARSNLTLGDMVPQAATYRPRSPPPEKPPQYLSRLPRLNRALSVDHLRDVPSDHARGRAMVASPRITEPQLGKRLFLPDQRPLDREEWRPQFRKVTVVKQADPFILTTNDRLPQAERNRVEDALMHRRQTPYRGGANRCSSPNILAWE
jgi:hypothetical protein